MVHEMKNQLGEYWKQRQITRVKKLEDMYERIFSIFWGSSLQTEKNLNKACRVQIRKSQTINFLQISDRHL